ncbi:hypothetical protein [Streptomyces sp. NPDC052015]|uniref:hypothetical protein n=1 Tax=Streptomyces sp. NPDC052015 TaxID=3154755 RepID=UPI0034351AB5
MQAVDRFEHGDGNREIAAALRVSERSVYAGNADHGPMAAVSPSARSTTSASGSAARVRAANSTSVTRHSTPVSAAAFVTSAAKRGRSARSGSRSPPRCGPLRGT